MPLKRNFLIDRQLNVCTNDWFNSVNLCLLTECISTLVELTRWIFSSTFYSVSLVLCNKVAFVRQLVALASLSLGKIVNFLPSRDCWVPGVLSAAALHLLSFWGEGEAGRRERGGPFWVWCLGLELWTRQRSEVGPGGSGVSEGWFEEKALTDSPGFFLFLPLDGRSNSSVWASVLKEHDLDPALWDTSERNHDWSFVPKGSRFSLWDFKDIVWSGHGCDWSWEVLSTQFLALWCASVESTVSLAVILTSPSWLQDSERDGPASSLHRKKFCSESMFV